MRIHTGGAATKQRDYKRGTTTKRGTAKLGNTKGKTILWREFDAIFLGIHAFPFLHNLSNPEQCDAISTGICTSINRPQVTAQLSPINSISCYFYLAFFSYILWILFKTDESKAYVPPTNILFVRTMDKYNCLYNHKVNVGAVPQTRLQPLSFTSFLFIIH